MQRENQSLPPDAPIAAELSSLLILPFPLSFTLSDPEPTTYNDMYTRVKQISSGLYHLGLGKDNWRDEDGKERVGVYADTRYDCPSLHQTPC